MERVFLCCAGNFLGELGACPLLTSVAFSYRKHAAHAVVAVKRIGHEGKVQAIGASVIHLPLQRIQIKGHKSLTGVIGGHYAFFTA